VPHKTSVRRRTNFTIVENEVIYDPILSASDKLVYMVLASFSNNDSGKCWPAISTLSKLAKLNRTTVQSSIDHLEKAGYMLIERSSGYAHVYWIGQEASKVKNVTGTPGGSRNILTGGSPNHDTPLSEIGLRTIPTENETQENMSNGHHTTQSFTTSWQASGGGKLSPHDYKKVKELATTYPTEELDVYISSYFTKQFWFNKDKQFNMGSFYANLGSIMGNTVVASERVRSCPKCGGGGQQSLTGGAVMCTSCKHIYDGQTKIKA
jgi:hypothetical protein